MATLHLFNPEHDLALAYRREGFTPPAAARRLRAGLGFLPAFWAEPGDLVLVDDAVLARQEAARWAMWLPEIHYVSWEDLTQWLSCAPEPLAIDPWGWDASLRHRLAAAGVPEPWLPAFSEVEDVRRLSHRSATIPMLEHLVATVPHTVGLRQEAHTLEEVRGWMEKYGRVVLKSPWSSSGRGVRFADGALSSNLEGFVHHVLQQQGVVIIEPWYQRVTDFAMEYWCEGNGMVRMMGLSLFTTVNGAYTGNVLATEEEKWGLLAQLHDASALRQLSQAVANGLSSMCGSYRGPVGVDMMVVDADGMRAVHPCVEVNVRRTMGMVAVDVARRTNGHFHVMTIDVSGAQCQLHLKENP